MRWGLALAGFLTGAAAPAAAEVSIVIDGDAEAHFILECASPGEEAPFRSEGHPPARYQLDGTDLDCTLRQTAEGARIVVSVESASGNRSHLATSGAGSVLRFVVK